MDEHGFAVADLFRRLENIVRRGRVEELDAANARIKARIGTNVTGWLPWLALRASSDSAWHAPAVGEQILVLSESGDFNNGVALTGIYQAAHPAPSNNPAVKLDRFSDGAEVSYDKDAHRYTLDVPAGGEILLRIGNTSLSLTDTGTTLTTPAFEGVQA